MHIHLYDANRQYHKNQSAEWYKHHLRDDTSASVAILKEVRHHIDFGEVIKSFAKIVDDREGHKICTARRCTTPATRIHATDINLGKATQMRRLLRSRASNGRME